MIHETTAVVNTHNVVQSHDRTATDFNMLQTADWYTRGGWHVFPCVPGDKTPITTHGLNDATRDRDQIAHWWTQTSNANIGLNCGASSLIVIDFDTYKPEFAGADLLALLLADYPTTTADSARGGVHLLYQQPATPLGCSRGSLPVGVDAKGHGGYIVLAPSLLNENGRRYMWRPGLGPHEQKPQPLPAFLLEMLQPKPTKTATFTHFTTGDHSFTDDLLAATDALKRLHQRRRDDYQEWVSVGMALTPLGDAGLRLWDEWSQHSDKYDPDGCAKKWASFNGHGLGLGSLIAWANEDSPRTKTPTPILVWPETTADTPEAGQDEPEERNPLDTKVNIDALNLGWIGEYADLMTELTCSPRQFNILGGIVAGATAIGRTAFLPMAWGNVYANIYAALVGPSTGFFKSTSMAKTKNALQRAQLTERLLPNDFTYEGLVKTLATRSTGLTTNDEIHRILGSQNTKYQLNLKPALTDLYDCQPFERTLSSGTQRVPEPFLCIYGATTHSRFHDSVSHLDWMDGFLVRWIFVTVDGEPDHAAVAPMPTTAHQEAADRLARRLNAVSTQRPAPMMIAPETYQLWQDWRIDANKRAWNYGDEVVTYVVGRYATYALKFAIILSALAGDFNRITPETMRTAMNLADWFKSNIYQLMDGKQRHSVTGAKLVKVFTIIKRTPEISTSRLCQLANMKKAELTPVLLRMLECGYVSEEQASTNGKKYRAIVDAIPTTRWR